MHTESLTDQLDVLELKARQAAVRIRTLSGVNDELKALNHQLKLELDKANERIRNLEAQNEPSDIATTTPDKDVRAFKQDIQRYITEIDKCIEWLNKQP